MTLAKLTITPLDPSELEPIEVLFNPNTYSIAKPVSWTQPTSGGGRQTYRELDAPPLVFGGGGARSLSLQLFFDVTERGADADVRTETNKIVALTRIERERQQPPVCRVSWGAEQSGSDFPF